MAKKVPEALPSWTVMVLMGADNVGGEKPLAEEAEKDLAEMEDVPFSTALNIVVQIDRAEGDGGPARYFIGRTGRQELEGADGIPDGQGKGGPEILQNFLTWAKQRYPAKHYMLVLWGHAYRLAFNRDPQSPDGLDFPQVATVLQNTNEAGNRLDIVAFDSCNVSLLEGAYQLRDVADYLVASQFTDPLPGWPYDVILKRVGGDKDHFTGPEGPKDFGRAIVSQFVRSYEGQKNVTMTMLELSRVEEIGQRVGDLAIELAIAVNNNRSELEGVRDLFRRSQVPESQPSVDLATFCWHLLNFSSSEKVRIAAASVGDLLLRPSNPFVAAHGRSDLVVAMLQGVSILAPNVLNLNRETLERLRQDYNAFDLAQNTLWGELVFSLAGAN
jgi:hypothetical protein